MSQRILHIDSSIFAPEGGVSPQLTKTLVDAIASREDRITHRMLSPENMPHFSEQTIEAIGKGQAQLADSLIEELQGADTLVIGVPMYNFTIPSTLKAWFDHVARAGTTFRYTSSGSEGLLNDKRVFFICTRGGRYVGTDKDVQTPLIRIMFEFLGLTNLTFIYAEGLNMGDESKAKALADAHEHIKRIATEYEA
jgi:FMN-dependent NADH-azoreductase